MSYQKSPKAFLKKDLIHRMRERFPELIQSDLEDVVDSIFEQMGAALAERRRIEIRGFGAFWCTRQKGRRFINPRNGKETSCPSSFRIVFRPGKGLNGR